MEFEIHVKGSVFIEADTREEAIRLFYAERFDGTNLDIEDICEI